MSSVKIFIFFAFLLASAVCVSAQSDSIPTNVDFTDLLRIGPKKIKNLELGFFPPNELEGYKFSKEGKIKGLKLGISTKDDVKEIFGKNCEDLCEYDNDWRIFFSYFKDITKEVTEKGIKKKLVANPQWTDKIYSIRIVPKSRISLKEFKFPDEFYKGQQVVFGHDFSGHASGISIDVYVDSYGLKYLIFNKENYTTFKEEDKLQHGDLISIEYTIPNDLEDEMFTEQK